MERQPARIVVIGNAGGGKSSLARRLAARRGLTYVEVDAFTWQPGWELTPDAEYAAAHERAIAGEGWVIDGLGWLASIPARLPRATEIILVDMPLWVHFWLAAERQKAWAAGTLAHPPAGVTEVPTTKEMFESLFEVDRDYMPEIRRLVAAEEARGTTVWRITTLEELQRWTDELRGDRL